MIDPASAPTQALPYSVGSILAERYELEAMLGEGGMGTVFRALDRELDERVALKILHVEVAADKASLTRFRREVKLARRVTHRNVARTFDLGVHGTIRFLTMELVGGRSLGKHAAEGLLGLVETLRVASEVSHGLTAAHAAGVVHRDLKPENVLVTEDRVVLTDFGIARVADGGIEVMRTGAIVGTPAYMAPEQLENRAIDGRTDVYALGVMLFELLTGRLPFDGQTAFAIAAARLTQDAPDVRTFAPQTPDALVELVGHMLVRRREDRPDAPTVVDRIESLRGCSSGHRRARVGRLETLTRETLSALAQPRTVSIQPFTADAGHERLATVLETAIVDALVEARVAQVLVRPDAGSSREVGRATPSVAPPSNAGADLVVQGSLHVAKDRVRARLRVLDRRRSSPVWAGHVDGTLDDSLTLEDRVVEAVRETVRWQTSRDPGPRDPSLREAYDRARACFHRFSFADVVQSITILEEIEAKKPGDPRVRALLAHAILRVHTQSGARGHAALSRVEELALRALADDETIADAHHVIASVRYLAGDLVAALRAEEECLRHAPLYAEAHHAIGSLLCQGLFIDEGRRRVELAARLEPRNAAITIERLRLGALLGENDRVRELLRDAKLQDGPLSVVVMEMRLAIWWKDRDMAREVATVLHGAQSGASWGKAGGLIEAFANDQFVPEAIHAFAAMTSTDVAPRHRCLMNEVATEYFAQLGQRDHALRHIVELQRLPFTDLLWLDKCPALDSLRDDPLFSETRAAVAVRVAELWS